jgi:hypothetical protein
MSYQIPNMQARITNLATNREVAPGEQVSFDEIKTSVLMIAFRVESTGNLLLYVEQLNDTEWSLADKTACYKGTSLWQCILKKPVFRARLKNVSDAPITLTIDVNTFERVAEGG